MNININEEKIKDTKTLLKIGVFTIVLGIIYSILTKYIYLSNMHPIYNAIISLYAIGIFTILFSIIHLNSLIKLQTSNLNNSKSLIS